MQIGRVLTCDSSFCPLLFGDNPHDVSSISAIGIQLVVNTNFQETQVPEEEDDKGASLCNYLY